MLVFGALKSCFPADPMTGTTGLRNGSETGSEGRGFILKYEGTGERIAHQ